MARLLAFVLALGVTVGATRARADDDLRSLCPDRPGKASSACTVDAGHVQLESDLFNGAFQHLDGVTTDTYLVTNPTLKYGVTDDLDLELGLSPLEIVRTHDDKTGVTETDTSVGDLFFRAKWAAIGNGGSDFALLFEPFLKVPTADKPIGNGVVEGGLIVPLSVSLGGNWTFENTAETDALGNVSAHGYHAAFSDVVSVSRGFDGGVTLGAEIWEATDFDPAGATQQYSLDADLAWIPASVPDLQLDAGVNFGLNRNTPGVQLYSGISQRF